MSAAQEPRAAEWPTAWHGAPWWYRAGLALVLCGMALLVSGPFLPWFHTELLSPNPDLSGVPPTSFVGYLLWSFQVNMSFALGIALIYIFLALGASVTGIKTLATLGRRQAHRQTRRDERSDAQVGALAALCGTSLLSLCVIGLNGSIPFAWPPVRILFDWGYFVTLAGFVLALAGNVLLARGKGERPALV